jgi:hypothetical protein
MTITLTREEAQQVLLVLEYPGPSWADSRAEVAATLRTRLAQSEPKDDGHCQACEENHCTAKTGCVALSNPPQREWQGLTDEERTYLAWESNNGPHCVSMTEAKLKEKNT